MSEGLNVLEGGCPRVLSVDTLSHSADRAGLPNLPGPV